MFRFAFAALALISFAFAQSLPAIRWVHQVDGSGSDTFAGLATDSQGNSYVAGSTLSTNFPVQAAAQSHLASAGLYRIDGPGSTYAALGLTSASSIAVDPQDPRTLYATSLGAVLRSTDGGVTFSSLPLPSSSPRMIAINPDNDQILYAVTFDQGILRSTDAGATWTAINNGIGAPPGQRFSAQNLWIDPNTPNVLFAETLNKFVRSSDGGENWQTLYSNTNVNNVYFDPATPGVLYAPFTSNGMAPEYGAFKSTDHGLTFTTLTTPSVFYSIVSDPNQPKRLLGVNQFSIFESLDEGSTWTQTPIRATAIVPDWANGVLYATTANRVLRISSDLQTITPVGPPAVGFIQGIAVANGSAYVAVTGTHDVFVTKLDPSGNVVYSTYFGGSADDIATAMTVDGAGNVYVTGTTTSVDFPVTKGTYSNSGGSFLFRLNPDGSVGYSTYFAPSGNAPNSLAVDSSGSAYIAGVSFGHLPVTPGAYQTTCNCASIPAFVRTLFPDAGVLTRFDPTGSTLIFSTYVGPSISLYSAIDAIALAADGSVYVGGPNGIHHINATGTTQLSSSKPIVNAAAIALGPDGSLYLAGPPGINPFQTTAGTFQPTIGGPVPLPNQGILYSGAAVIRMDAQLATVLASTYFVGLYGNQIKALTVDPSGKVYLAGSTAPRGLPTVTPLQGGFAPSTGFVSELSSDLSTLLFSSYFGDTETFSVQSVALSPSGDILTGGSTGQPFGGGPINIYVNRLGVAPPPSLRIDAVQNAASLLDGSICAGETIVVRGVGFGSDAQLSIGDKAVRPISITTTAITAVVPQSVPADAAMVQMQSGGASSNQVLIQVSAASPGIFSADGSGYGQAYILNKDGSLNTPANPAAPGDAITIFATGVGPVSFTNGYAVTDFPVNVFIDGFYANGVAAVMGQVKGLPGDVYQITVYVPNPATLVANNPNLANFKFPPLDSVLIQVAGKTSQIGLAISIAQ